MKTNMTLIAIILMVAACSSLADWPQYLGPDRNAISPEKGLLRSWPEAGPEVLWTISLGAGYGGAAVSDGKVYVLDRDGNDKDVLRCLDLVRAGSSTRDREAPRRLTETTSIRAGRSEICIASTRTRINRSGT